MVAGPCIGCISFRTSLSHSTVMWTRILQPLDGGAGSSVAVCSDGVCAGTTALGLLRMHYLDSLKAMGKAWSQWEAGYGKGF